MPPLVPKTLPNHGNLVWQIGTAENGDPITASEVKAWGKIDTDAEDTTIANLITAITQIAEPWLGRAIMEQVLYVYLDWWPDNPIYLPRPPLVSVSSIVTIDEEDNETTYSSDNYFVRTETTPGQIIIKDGAAPPINTDRYYGGFKITFTAGYSDDADNIPQALKQGLIEWVLDALENRVVSREPPDKALPLLGRYFVKHSRI